MLFSVGDGGGGAGGDVVVSGAFCSSLAQDAVKPTIATIATPPATAARRRAKRHDSMLVPIYMCRD
jgi:hypothetical protein